MAVCEGLVGVIGPERAIGATVYPATEISEPGVIRHIYGDKFGFGEPTREQTPRVMKLVEAFDAGVHKQSASISRPSCCIQCGGSAPEQVNRFLFAAGAVGKTG